MASLFGSFHAVFLAGVRFDWYWKGDASDAYLLACSGEQKAEKYCGQLQAPPGSHLFRRLRSLWCPIIVLYTNYSMYNTAWNVQFTMCSEVEREWGGWAPIDGSHSREETWKRVWWGPESSMRWQIWVVFPVWRLGWEIELGTLVIRCPIRT